jgi:poly(hydroxyalkanoate) depolymerase family esterase
MNMKIPGGLAYATRLVRGGKLTEATDAIQRALRGLTGAAEPEATEIDVIEGTCHVVVEPAVQPRARADLDIAPRTPAAPAREHGEFIARSYSNAAGTRDYKVYVPATYDGQALPLVVMLHGCKQNPDDFAAGTRMNELAEAHGFLVVYPEQAGKANGANCWNWFETRHQKREGGEPSLIAGITREVVAAYGLDSRRVYVAGLSAGGAMAAVMGTTYPDLYAALGIHSGLPYQAARDMASAFAAMRGDRSTPVKRKSRRDAPARGVPTIVFHGDKDTTVHPSNGDELIVHAAAASMEAKARDNAYAEHVTSVEHGDVAGRAYTRTTHRDSAGKPVLEQWLVHGAAHAWSGGSADGSFADPKGPDASREMLRFFLEHQNT